MNRLITIVAAGLAALVLIAAERQEVAGVMSHAAVTRFAIIGDRAGEHQPGIYEEIVSEVQQLRPDFVMTVGDEIEGYSEDTTVLNTQWDEYYAIVKPLTMPLYLIASNHNITTDPAEPVFEKRVGKPYRSFDVGSIHLVLLDNSRWESGAQLPGAQLDWLAADLAANRSAARTIVFMHKPLWYNSLGEGKPDTLHTLFVKYGVDAVFAGHFHQYFSTSYDSILYTCIGSSGGAIDDDPTGMGYHFAWVTVDGDGIHVAPIKMNSVQKWDVVTLGDQKLIEQVNRAALTVGRPVPVSPDLTVAPTTIEVDVRNWVKDVGLNDTLKWDVPTGWVIEPQTVPVSVPPDSSRRMTFTVRSTGNLYPLPSISTRVPFKPDRSVSVKADLRAARQTACLRADSRPTIDGRIVENTWKAPVSSLFRPEWSTVQIESTYFYFAYDNANLYLAARCRESVLDSLRAATTRRDGSVFGEDCIGYFIQPDLRKDTAYQIYFSALGTIFDQKISRVGDGYYGGDKSWDGSYEVKTSQADGYWSVEARVPLAQLGIHPARGKQMGINFLRKQQRLASAADWQVPIDYNPKSYGVLEFE